MLGQETAVLLLLCVGLLLLMAAVTNGAGFSLDGIKGRTVGDGQHGTARFAGKGEIRRTFHRVRFRPRAWRRGKHLPKVQGLVVGCEMRGKRVTALVDSDDIHAMMVAGSGAGKTAYFLYPNLEYCCAAGMSFLTSDTKGDLARNYAGIAKDIYGYDVSVLDLRNPVCSDGNNLLDLVNKYMDAYMAHPDDLASRARAEKYAKIIAKTVVTSSSGTEHGQNSYFYDAAEGLITSVILLVAEFCPPETRHIVSVFKLIQDLLSPSGQKGKNQLQMLLSLLPPEHKARWFAGAALTAGEQAMASVLSTAMASLNAFLDSELEQMLCFSTKIDAEKFCREKSAVFVVLPEEDSSKYFMVSLLVQQMYREILVVADGQGGALKNRVMFFLDELGSLPKIESLELMFSAARSRRLSIVGIIQSYGQLERNYGKEGCSIILDNAQDTIAGGFSPAGDTAEQVSRQLGEQTVMTGSVSRGKSDPSRSLQMMGRRLMTPDELKSMPKGQFIVMKTGRRPMLSKLRLFLDWGITFTEPYALEQHAQREVKYAGSKELRRKILKEYGIPPGQQIVPGQERFPERQKPGMIQEDV